MKKIKWNIDLIKKEVLKITNNEYGCVSNEYINNKTKLTFFHKACSNTFEMAFNDFFNHNYRCPYCKIKNKTKTTEEFKNEIKKKFGEDYELITEYTKNNEYVKVKHLKCNTVFQLMPRKINFRKGCPKCNKEYSSITKTTDQFKREVYELVGNEYTVENEYKNCHIKIEMKHNLCKKSFNIEPNNFLKGVRCPYCKKSKGESKIIKWLDKNNYEYSCQAVFKNCKDKYVLPFDFKLQDDSGKIILIEYDGIQHYKKSWFDTEESFKLRKKHDEIKNQYCKDNNIDLYRISYKDFNNIETILENIINNYER